MVGVQTCVYKKCQAVSLTFFIDVYLRSLASLHEVASPDPECAESDEHDEYSEQPANEGQGDEQGNDVPRQ